jgi:DNA primase
MARADTHFRHQLRHHPQARRAIDYLKGRGLSGVVAAEFGLGFAPPGWRNLIDTLGGDAPAVQRLVLAGLVVEQHDKHYDRFRDRIMFPIRDRRGRTIGFGGRVLGDDKPKYLNSPETPLFRKGRELYGLFEARKALRRIDRLLIVEGYMDVIALAQFGIRYAVATLGTATTADHLERLFRVTRELVFSFDGDRAGREAAWKALNVALPVTREGREIRFLFLPEGEDPDTLVRKIGAVDFAEQVRTAEHLSDVLFSRLSAEIDMHSIDGRAHLAEQAKPLLQRLPPGVFREMMVARLAKLTELEPEQLGFRPTRKKTPTLISRTSLRSMPLVRKAIALLLQNPAFAQKAQNLPGTWRKLTKPGIAILGQILEIASENPDIRPAALVERWRDSETHDHLNKLISFKFETPADGLESEFLDTLRRLNKAYENQELDRLRSASLSSLSEEEKRTLRKLTDRPATPSDPDRGPD